MAMVAKPKKAPIKGTRVSELPLSHGSGLFMWKP